MQVPLRYEINMPINTICRLKKVLYGLKQSPRPWFGRFVEVMISSGYKQSQEYRTLFIKHSPQEGVTIMLVYVDGIIMTRDDWKE